MTSAIYVVFGLDTNKKPHAARFSEAESLVAGKAAALMGFHGGKAQSEKAVAAAKALPEGKLFATGKGLVPLVKKELYDQIAELIVPEQSVAAAPSKPDAVKSTVAVGLKLPDLWAALKVGSTVLALDKEQGSYFEAVVVGEAPDGKALSLRWQDFPDLKKFNRTRNELAILPTKLV